MLGIILTGHGSFATGLYEAATQIIGKQPQFTAINFPDGMSSEQLEEQLHQAFQETNCGDGVLSYQHQNIEVISGVNMPLLLEILLLRENLDITTIRQETIENGKQTITSLWH